MNVPQKSRRRIGFFVHHQGSGHAKRCQAIFDRLQNCDVTVFSAADNHFEAFADHVKFIQLPDMIAAPARVKDAKAQGTPDIFHCVPLGVDEMRRTFGLIAKWIYEEDPHLLVIDVSAELALLSRILSVPAVKIRMHGDRADPGHTAAYESCPALLAPYHKGIEDSEFSPHLRAKTFYSGGLCTTAAPPLEKGKARSALGLPADTEIILSINGAGGKGASYASLTLGARAKPDALWLTIGETFKEGHETDFPNLKELGWVKDGQDYIAAADIIIASGGDNTVTEIARLGRPFICIPEWRYFNEQHRKAEAFAAFGAAVFAEQWPGTLSEWHDLIDQSLELDLEVQAQLFDRNAATKSATFLIELMDRLWGKETAK